MNAPATTPPSTATPRPVAPEPQLVPLDPPPWIIRYLAWLLIGLFASLALAGWFVRVPRHVHAAFELTATNTLVQLSLPPAQVSRLATGQVVHLLIHGSSRYATARLTKIAPPPKAPHEPQLAWASIEPYPAAPQAPPLNTQSQTQGEAQIVVDSRPLLYQLLRPLQSLESDR